MDILLLENAHVQEVYLRLLEKFFMWFLLLVKQIACLFWPTKSYNVSVGGVYA